MSNQYRADLDGLRAVAVLLVVGFHSFPLNFSGGFIGVDVFFVISGFLITRLILDSQAKGRFSIIQFYLRRARRILPALSLVIAVVLIIGWFILNIAEYQRLALHALASGLFVPNLFFWSEAGYFDTSAANKPLLHLWSLGVEEQFYLIWPTLLFLIHWRKVPPLPLICALSIGSLIYSSIAAVHDPVAAFYSPLSRFWELGTGGLLAARQLNNPYPATTSVIGLVLIIGAAFLLTDTYAFPGLVAVIPVLGAALVIAGRSALLGNRCIVAIGLISYPLYLWHWPLLSLAPIVGFHTELSKAIIITISFFLAAITTRYVEYPIRFGTLKARGAAIAIAGTAAASIGAFLIYYSGGAPQRLPAEIRSILALQNYAYQAPVREGRCWLPGDANFSSYAPECGRGRTLVWGDSYSGLLATGLPKPYAQFTRTGCLPLLTGTKDQCDEGNEAVIGALASLKPDRIIIFGRWPVPAESWPNVTWQKVSLPFDAALANTLRKVRTQISDVVLLGPAPDWTPNLPEAVANYWAKFGVLPDRLMAAAPANVYGAVDQMMSAVAEKQNVHFVSLFSALCNASGCLTHTPSSRSQLLAWDYGHLTVEGAAYVVKILHLGQLPNTPKS
jgi:peptidoglycan/LPS O-acetylase OafA/YrhL